MFDKEGEEGDQESYESDEQTSSPKSLQQQQQQQRLSTILEVSCEESPFKKANPLKEFKNKIETVDEEVSSLTSTELPMNRQTQSNNEEPSHAVDQNERGDEEENATEAVLDIDNLPIGVKPTNKMTFEQLIEEKLKIADELDQEQFRRSGANKTKKKAVVAPSKTREKFLQAKAAKESGKPQQQQAPSLPIPNPQPAPQQQQVVVSSVKPPVEFETTQVPPTNGKQPRKYLKRGEGLKRYQPPSTKLAQKQSVSSCILT